MKDAAVEVDDEMSAEQAAALAALEAQIDDQPQQDAPPEGGAVAAVDSVAEARAILATAAQFAVGFWPWLDKVITQDNQEALAQAWGPVLDHYGVTLGGVVNHPVGAALLVTLPIAGQGFQAWREYHAANDDKPAIVAPAGSPESAGQDVTMLHRG